MSVLLERELLPLLLPLPLILYILTCGVVLIIVRDR